MLAQSPKYPALFDPNSGVRFTNGRAEVTEEQALKLAERRYVDGILIDGTPAKDWAKTQRRADSNGENVAVPPEVSADATPSPQNTEPTEDGRRTRRSK